MKAIGRISVNQHHQIMFVTFSKINFVFFKNTTLKIVLVAVWNIKFFFFQSLHNGFNCQLLVSRLPDLIDQDGEEISV